MDFLPTWANAVAQFEGFNEPGSRAARNHNPGNLKYAGQAGAIGKDPELFAVFSDDTAGFQALVRQLAKYVSDFPGYSLLQITAHYLGQPAPQVNQEGNAFTYAGFVASQLGVDPNTTLGQLAGGLIGTVAVPDAGSPAPENPNPGTGSNLLILVVGGGLIFWLINRLFGS